MSANFGAPVCALLMLCGALHAQPGTAYFKITTVSGAADVWTGSFEVADLSEVIDNTLAVALTTSFVGGLSNEPGYTFTSGNDLFVWQGDNATLGANSTVSSVELVAAVKGGATWQDLFGRSYALLGGLTTDLSVLNPVFLRVSGQGGTIQFSDEPFPLLDPYTQWLENYPGLTNTARVADPDGDGFDNGTEFAFDGDPTVPTPNLLRIFSDGSQAICTFIARDDIFPASYVVLSTTNLTSAPFVTNVPVTGSISNSLDQSGVLLGGEYTRKEFTVPLSLVEFFRIKADTP